MSYFSSAGNNARLSYEQNFTLGRNLISFDQAHDFGAAAGQASDFYQPITIPKDTIGIVSLQWDDPAEVAGGAGAQTDIDIFLLDSTKTQIITSSQDNNIGHNPIERFGIVNTSDITEYFLYISHRAGPAPTFIKHILYGPTAPWPVEVPNVVELDVNNDGATPVIVGLDGVPISGGRAVVVSPSSLFPRVVTIGNDGTPLLINSDGEAVVNLNGQITPIGPGKRPIWFVPDGFIAIVADIELFTIELFRADATFIPASINRYATHSSTLFGHPNASGAMAVGAIPYKETPWFTTPIDKAQIEYFSSAGGTPIFFTPDGKRLDNPDRRLKPEIIAPDDIDTTFFPDPENGDTDNNGLPNFRGTSASAPNAAALAALVLEAFPFLIPEYVHLAMTRGSLDLHDPSPFTEDAPHNSDCAPNTKFDFGTGCGLVQADRVFEVIIDAINSVFVSARTSSTFVTPGVEFTYTFDIKNQSDQTLQNARLRAIDLPDRVHYQTIEGCISIDHNEASCKLPDLTPGQGWTVKVPVITRSHPAPQLRFEVDLLTDSNVDLSQTHRVLVNTVNLPEGDFNSDGCVDLTDWGILFGVFRSGSGDNSQYDLTDDGLVTLDDLTALESLYSNPGGTPCF